MAEPNLGAKVERPLSPHLQVYRPMLSMMMSIVHRATGVALYVGSVLVVWWFLAAAQSDSYFDLVQAFFGHWFGRLVLFGFSWALIHHALGGLRHFVWDLGRGFKLTTVEWMVKANLIASIVLTIVLWIIAYGVKS
jgi:succinate dehydrogenase / fumarate reductase, cytochrome b subunit